MPHRTSASLATLSIIFVTFLLLTTSCTPRALADDDFLSEDYYLDDSYLDDSISPTINDPLETLNRRIFLFNDQLYIRIVDPLAHGYSRVVAKDIRYCISSFFNNLKEPIRLVNFLLQGRFSEAGSTAGRFAINSTLGVFGLADAAAREFDMQPMKTSVGETLHTWGVGDGCFLVVPFLGPSTLRDFSGDMLETFSTPHWNGTIYTESSNWVQSAAWYTGREINDTSLRLGEYQKLKQLALDPYTAFRNVYIQHRFQGR